MPVALPLVEGSPIGMPAADVTAGSESTGSAQPTATSSAPGFPSLGGFGHADNTSMHVAILVGAALVGLVALHIGGFRFAVDAGVTRI